MNLSLARILVAPDPFLAGDGHRTVSIGVVLDGGVAGWGDLILPLPDEPNLALTDALRLRDLITPSLAGQRFDSFREFCARLRATMLSHVPGLISGEVAVAGLLALQQAFLHAVLAASGQSADDLLRAEFNLPASEEAAAVPFYLELSDARATVQRIDRMIALRPAGLGYRLTGERVAEAIGEQGEYLQRFVRELGQRVTRQAPGERYRPAVYLALNGALGVLAGDPVRHLGNVLGNVVGLENAAGDRRLVLETPFLLPEPVDQAANLLKLRGYVHRSNVTAKRASPTLLVADATALDEPSWRMLIDTAAVHALRFDPLAAGDLDLAATALAATRAAGLDTLLSIPAGVTPRWATTLTALAEAARPLALLVSADDDGDTIAQLVARQLSEAEVLRAQS